jgi:hypothetical protein
MVPLMTKDPIILAARRIHALEGSEELKAAYERIQKMEDALEDCRDFFDGTDAPVLVRIKEALS